MSTDPNLSIEIDHDVAEVGGAFRCAVRRSPVDGEINDKTFGKARSVRLSLRMYTEGRGNEDQERYALTEFPIDEYGMATGIANLVVPAEAPVSYDGQLIRVRYEIEARTDLHLARDQRSSAEVLVVPRGGLGAYRRPHPLR